MTLGHHCTFTTYGTWLPNEPRGSWSQYVASWDLYQFGPATKVDTHRSVAHRPFNRDEKRKMQDALAHPPVKLIGEQALVVATSFAELPYNIYALAVMPNHLHLVVGSADRSIRQIIGHIKSTATRALREQGWFEDHSPWTAGGWNVRLYSLQDMRRAIAYVENNPERDGLKRQRWSCVKGYGGGD